MASVVNSTSDSASPESTSMAEMCRGRDGEFQLGMYNVITCTLCYLYVYRNHNVSLDARTFELVTGSNTAYSEGIRMTADVDDPKSVSLICGSLWDSSECWMWQDCCRKARTCCEEQIKAGPKPYKEYGRTLCPRTWDGYACWPDTPAGQRRRIQCPAHVPHASTGQSAYKTCSSNATWFVSPDSGREWTDYTECSSPVHYRRLYMAGLVCNIITIVLLLPAFFIFLYYKPLRQQHRIRLHLCLMGASFMTSVCSLIWEVTVFKDTLETHSMLNNTSYQHSIGCRLLFALLRYAELTSFMWMFIEGFHLHRLLVRAFLVPKTLTPYYICGFGFPLLSVTAYATVRGTNAELNQKCWIEEAGDFEWLILLPTLIFLAANIVFLLRIVFIMIRQLEPHPNEPSNFRRAVKAVMVLVPLFGVQFTFFVYRPEVGGEYSQVSELLSKICSGLQGSFIVIVFCYFNKEVQGYLKTSCVRMLGRNFGQDVNFRSSVATTNCLTDMSRARIHIGCGDPDHSIPLRTVHHHHGNHDDDNENDAKKDLINGTLHIDPEHFFESLALNSSQNTS